MVIVTEQMRQHAVRVVRQCGWVEQDKCCDILSSDSVSWRTVVAAMCQSDHDFSDDLGCQLVVHALARSICLTYDIPAPSADDLSLIYDDYVQMSY